MQRMDARRTKAKASKRERLSRPMQATHPPAPAVPRQREHGGEGQVIMLIRHGEKPLPSRRAQGITANGRRDKRSLTVEGWLRAGALAELFAPSRGDRPSAGLRRPDAVYGAGAQNGKSKRSIQTVKPLADRVGVDVVDRFAAGEEAQLAQDLADRPGATVVSWHHNSIHKIVKHLGEVTPAPPRRWPHDRYDVVWKLTRVGQGWRFEQVPQMLMPGDQPEPIAG
jgi:hypothetical protein